MSAENVNPPEVEEFLKSRRRYLIALSAVLAAILIAVGAVLTSR